MEGKLTFQEILSQAKLLIKKYQNKEQRPWGVEGSMIELTKQMGDLAKRIMVYEKYYLKDRESNPTYQTTKNDIADELADIVWNCIRLALNYDIDLEKSLLDMIKKSTKLLK
jgi:NTP pyrophosphatase (non-canonical NTP hydrolase)